MKTEIILTLLSSLAFIFYGYQCLSSDQMTNEFKRFGLSHQLRCLTGWLEIAGGVGLLVGFYVPFIFLIASGGLALLMAICLYFRVKLKDGLWLLFPAFILMLFNAWIFSNVYFDVFLIQK